MSARALGADTGRRMLDRIDALESRYRGLLQNAHGQPVTQGPPFCIWGRTTTNQDYPTYPTSGNVVVCELGVCDASPLSPGSTASNNFTALDPPEYVVAKSYDSPLPFAGQVVPLRWMGGQWWYWHPNFRKAIADVSIAAGASGNVSIYDGGSDIGTRTAYYTWADSGGPTIDAGDEIFITWRDDEAKWIILPPGGSSTSTAAPTCVLWDGDAVNYDLDDLCVYQSAGHANNRWCYYFPAKAWGDMAATKVEVLNTLSTLASYEDPMFRTTDGGLYRFDVRLTWQFTGTAPSYNSTTLTTSASSGHTHTVAVREEDSLTIEFDWGLEWRDGVGAWNLASGGEDPMSAIANTEWTSINTTASVPEGVLMATFWQNHNAPNREYRLVVYLSGTKLKWVAANLETQILAQSGVIQITRLADYAADQTL